MSLIKLNNRAVKDVTQFGSISSLGSLTHISTATASASASIEFTSGIDSTYKEYIFYFVDIHPATDDTHLQFNFSTDGGSNYNVTKTTTAFRAYHDEADTATILQYQTGDDLAQSTSFQRLSLGGLGNDNDQSTCGYLTFIILAVQLL
jgi:FlaG/FlaF family flagellin (archaellin)